MSDDGKITIYSIQDDVWGNLYYNPFTCEGVILEDSGGQPVNIGMDRSYNQTARQIGKPVEVEEAGFKKLRAAAEKRDKDKVTEVLAEYFPEEP